MRDIRPIVSRTKDYTANRHNSATVQCYSQKMSATIKCVSGTSSGRGGDVGGRWGGGGGGCLLHVYAVALLVLVAVHTSLALPPFHIRSDPAVPPSEASLDWMRRLQTKIKRK